MASLDSEHIEFIAAEVISHYEESGEPIYLSTIGTSFVEKFGSIRPHFGVSLRELIERDLVGRSCIGLAYRFLMDFTTMFRKGAMILWVDCCSIASSRGKFLVRDLM
jgi:hypothetical protein